MVLYSNILVGEYFAPDRIRKKTIIMRPQSISCLILFLLLLQDGSAASATNDATKDDRLEVGPRQHNTSGTARAVRADPSRSVSKINVYDVSLAERLPDLATSNSDFEKRLRREEEEQHAARTSRLQRLSSDTTTTTTSSSSSSWYWMSGLMVLFGAATFAAPATVWPDIQLTLTRVVGLQVFTQLLSYMGNLPTTNVGGWGLYVNALWIIHLVMQQPAMRQAWCQHVWPVLTSTSQKLLMAEAWVLIWKQVEDVWKILWDEPQSSATTTTGVEQGFAGKDGSNSTGVPDSWVQRGYDKMLKVFHKGGPKFVKALLKKHIEEFVFYVFSEGVSIAREATFGT